MYFKRPSFRRGGSTGIGQLTPNRQMYAGGGNIGGGGIGGRNLGTRTGFNVILNEFGQPFKSSTANTAANVAKGSRYGFLPKGGIGPNPLYGPVLPRGALALGPYASSAGIAAVSAIPIATAAGLAYMNKPKTMEEKKVMRDYGMIDETFFDYDKYDADREAASKIGDKISFREALFKDPDTGLYPKIFGSTESRTKRAQIEKNKQEQEDIKTIIESDGPAGDQITMLSDEAKGAATEALLKSIEEKKKRVEPGSDDSSITLDPYAEIKKEKDFLSEMLKNEGLERGEIALIAAKAIGTEGSFKDKLDAAVELALPVVRRRNKEDKALTLTAYKSFKEKEKAQAKATADASKPTVGMKELQYQAKMILKSGDKSRGDTQDEVITSLISEKFKSPDQTLRRETLVRAQEKVFESFDDLKDSKKAYDDYVKTKYLDKEKEIDVTDKKLINLQRKIDENLNIFKLFYDVPEFSEQYPAYVDAFNRLGLKEGGRVKRALGSPDTGEQIITSETETIGAETAQKPVLKLTYNDLRNRLPQEITDDVVELLANSEEALQDFAYIQTQNDVDSFNIKYGVNLIIPPAPQTA